MGCVVRVPLYHYGTYRGKIGRVGGSLKVVPECCRAEIAALTRGRDTKRKLKAKRCFFSLKFQLVPSFPFVPLFALCSTPELL